MLNRFPSALPVAVQRDGGINVLRHMELVGREFFFDGALPDRELPDVGIHLGIARNLPGPFVSSLAELSTILSDHCRNAASTTASRLWISRTATKGRIGPVAAPQDKIIKQLRIICKRIFAKTHRSDQPFNFSSQDPPCGPDLAA